MLGAIIGDIVGSRFEFNPLQGTEFELFTSECSYTDDTICTIAVADAILNRNDDYKSALVDWCKRYPHPMGGYGARFAKWIDNPVPYNSYGNGAVMRISPIPLLSCSEDNVMLQAWAATEISHNHPDAIRYAIITAFLIHRFWGGEEKKEKEISIAMHMLGIESLPAIKPQSNPFDETVYNCVRIALACLINSTDFESAIRNAMIIGGDTDTIGACVGAMAEALYGIPDEIRDKAMEYLPDEMKAIIEQAYQCKY